ncbi:MAG: Ig domain-containing protein [Patescibacteria group bacterium]|jgi:hypothetical protein|nr:Ig domain-containing protein [Patescibacteria group bacterium]
MIKIFNKLNFSLILLFFILFSVKGSVAQSVLTPCNIDAVDQEGNSFSYSLTETTPGVVIDPNTGIISGSSASVGTHIIEVTVTDEYGAVSDPYAYTLVVDSYCGDNGVQTPNSEGDGGPINDGNEECDGLNGIAFTPSESSMSKSYACSGPCFPATDCTGSCSFLDSFSGGGWCGDGIVQSAHPITGNPLETCDPMETKADYELRVGPVSDSTFAVLQLSCSSDCQLGCATDPDLARGCYIDTNDNGIIDSGECQKGMFTCENTGMLECFDIFSVMGGSPVFDECCRGNVAELQDGNIVGTPFLVVRALASDMGIGGYVMDHSNLVYYSSVFNCDDVCLRENRVCVGVGLSQVVSNSCVSVMHDNGNDCNLNSNLATNDCKSGYLTGGVHCMETATAGFRIGETLCYCY